MLSEVFTECDFNLKKHISSYFRQRRHDLHFCLWVRMQVISAAETTQMLPGCLTFIWTFVRSGYCVKLKADWTCHRKSLNLFWGHWTARSHCYCSQISFLSPLSHWTSRRINLCLISLLSSWNLAITTVILGGHHVYALMPRLHVPYIMLVSFLKAKYLLTLEEEINVSIMF